MNEAQFPKFTVVVPTRARAELLSSCLETVVRQDYPNLQIIVSDNFSGDSTEDVVRSFSDPRIKYYNTGKRLSMSHNWEFALSHVTDGWVCIVGDDDGLMPGALRRVIQLAQETGTSAVRSSVCKYKWPTADNIDARLNVPLNEGHEIRVSATWLEKAMKGNASYADLPMLYTGGFADIRVVNAIREKTGTFYHSCVPDVYSGVAISSVISSYVYSHTPLAVAGVSRHSLGTSHFSGTKEGPTSPIQQFISESNIPFHEAVPVCANGVIPRSPHVTLLESFLQSEHLRSAPAADFFERQLEAVISTSFDSDSDIEKWLEDFSRLHHLQLDSIRWRGKWRRLRLKLMKAPSNAIQRLRTAKLRSPGEDIENVYLASLAAARVLGKA